VSEESRGNSLAKYKQRYKAYEEKYISSWPEPELPPAPQSGGSSVLGAQKTAHKRQQVYNDKKTTQTTKEKQ
jgi:hypothetical protein